MKNMKPSMDACLTCRVGVLSRVIGLYLVVAIEFDNVLVCNVSQSVVERMFR